MSLQIPVHVWIEFHAGDDDVCDVIVEMEDGTIYTSLFVTPAYLYRQMELTFDLSKQIPDVIPVRFAVLETPHIAIESLERGAIEDTIDNLLAMEVFECAFTQVTESPTKATKTTNFDSHRTTQEVAAVVLSDVLVVKE